MNDILVLNQSYLPLAKTNHERAIILILLDKAFSIKDSDKVLRSVYTEIKVPEIIVLKDCGYFRRNLPLPTRKNVLREFSHTCQHCQEQRRDRLSLEHIIPRSRFSKIKKDRDLDYLVSDWKNLSILCRDCNVTKSDKLPEEIGWDLVGREPVGDLVWDWEKLFDLGMVK